MTFEDWLKSYELENSGDGLANARLWNLRNERRIDGHLKEFHDLVVTLFTQNLGSPSAHRPATDALNVAADECSVLSSRWTGLLPLPRSHDPGEPLVTNLRSRVLARYGSRTPFNPDNPPRQVRIDPPGTSRDRFGSLFPRKRFVWVIWGDDARRLSDDPTGVKRELGLDHFEEGEYVFRCLLHTDPASRRLYVPTCLDAGVNGVWAPPPAVCAHPWGMTRDLVDGEHRCPELVVEVADLSTVAPHVADLVSPAGISVPIGPLAVNYMAKRP